MKTSKSKTLIVSLLLISLLTLLVSPVNAYVLIGAKQDFYYNNVIEYKWADYITSGDMWYTAFSAATTSWNSATSEMQWGEVSRDYDTQNIMGVYYLENSSEYGRTQLEISGGIITRAWMELNQYSLTSKSANWKQFTACHEEGHALGLDHNTVYSIMNSSMNPEEFCTPRADDKTGVNAIY